MTLVMLKILQPSGNERINSPTDYFCCTVEILNYQALNSKSMSIERSHTSAISVVGSTNLEMDYDTGG